MHSFYYEVRKPYGLRDFHKVRRKYGNHCRIHCNVAALSHCNAQIGPGKSGTVVDSVSHHCNHMPALLQLLYKSSLVCRQHGGPVMFYSGSPCHCSGRGSIISCEHIDLYAHLAESRHSLRRSRLDCIRYRHKGNDRFRICKTDDCIPLFCALFKKPALLLACPDSGLHQQRRAAGKVESPFILTFHPLAGNIFKVFYFRLVSATCICA